MSASSVRVIRLLRRLFVGDRTRPAPWRQFPAHDSPRADQKGDADNRRRGERGEILQHDPYLDLGAAGALPRRQQELYPQVRGASPSDPGRGLVGRRRDPPFPETE